MARRNENVPPDLERMLDEVSAATMRRSALWLDGRFTEEISASKWNWTDGGTRDIVDEGLLRSSQPRRELSDGSVEWSWPREYATVVHEGGVRTNGKRFPGRPWTQLPLQELPEVAQKIADQEIRKWRG